MTAKRARKKVIRSQMQGTGDSSPARRQSLLSRVGSAPGLSTPATAAARTESPRDWYRLRALFRQREDVLRRIQAEEPEGFTFHAAEALLAIADGLGIGGLEKLARVGGVAKLRSLLSEVRIAALFARLGFHARLLPDDAFSS